MIGSLGVAPLITNEAFAAGLTLSPSSGQVGTVVTLSGSGYTATKTISAKFSGAAVTVSPANVKTTSTGAIPAGVTITIPTATAGAKTIVVNAASSSGSAIFTLTNTAPTAGAKTTSTNENAQVAITLTGTDANNDALTFAVA